MVLLKMPSLYDKLVNKVIQAGTLWKVDRVETDDRSRSTAGFTQPFITISREPGSGGKPVAQLIAKQLGFDFYDKQIIEDLAKSVRQRKVLLEKVDERGRSDIEDIVHSLLNPDYVSDIRYMNHLSRVVLSAALKGEVVILGRGANFITPFDKGLHVRIGAPYAVRVERAVKYEEISKEEAIEIIKETDRRRKEFIGQYFGKNISNPNYYDLIINTADMGIEDAAEHVVLALKNKFPRYAKKRRKLFEKMILTF